MDTRLATAQVRLSTWSDIIKDRNASGLKIDDYCRQHNISRHAYFYWLRKVKEAALQQAGFVEVPVAAPLEPHTNPSFQTQLTLKVGEYELGINEGTPSELLTRTIEVIRRAQ